MPTTDDQSRVRATIANAAEVLRTEAEWVRTRADDLRAGGVEVDQLDQLASKLQRLVEEIVNP